MDSQAIDVAVLDVNETLFRIDGLVPFFEAAGLSAADVPLWFARTLRDGFALAAMGSYRSFADVTGAVLQSLDANPSEILAGFKQLQPHPDVAQGLALLQHTGIRVVTLTVGSAEITRALLSRWDLAGYVESAYDVSPVRRWKPAPEPSAGPPSSATYRLLAASSWPLTHGTPPVRNGLACAPHGCPGSSRRTRLPSSNRT